MVSNWLGKPFYGAKDEVIFPCSGEILDTFITYEGAEIPVHGVFIKNGDLHIDHGKMKHHLDGIRLVHTHNMEKFLYSHAPARYYNVFIKTNKEYLKEWVKELDGIIPNNDITKVRERVLDAINICEASDKTDLLKKVEYNQKAVLERYKDQGVF